MVHRDVAAFFFVIGEEREFRDPKEIELFVPFEQFLKACNLKADASEDVAGRLPVVGCEEDEVSRFDVEFAAKSFHFAVGHPLHEWRTPGRAVGVAGLNVGESLGSGFLSQLGELVDLTGGNVRKAFRVDCFDNAAVGNSAGEDAKFAVLEVFGKVNHLHADATFGLIGAIAIHGVFPGETLKGSGDFHSTGL